jgi:hypothetical protein
MSKKNREYKFLEEINDLDEELSQNGEDEFSDYEDMFFSNGLDLDLTDSEDETEDFLTISNNEQTLQNNFLESEEEANEDHLAVDGTYWEELQTGSRPGRKSKSNIFNQESGPTGYAKVK